MPKNLSVLEIVGIIFGILVSTLTLMTAIGVAARWVLKTLIRDEITPSVTKLTSSIAELRITLASAAEAQHRGAEELRATTDAIRAQLTDHEGRIGACEAREDMLWDRVDHVAQHPLLQTSR